MCVWCYEKETFKVSANENRLSNELKNLRLELIHPLLPSFPKIFFDFSDKTKKIYFFLKRCSEREMINKNYATPFVKRFHTL